MARRPVTAPITGPSNNRRMPIPGLVDEINLTMTQAYADMGDGGGYDDTALRGRVGTLEMNLSGLPARMATAETSISALSTASNAQAARIAALEAGGGGTIPVDVPRAQSLPSAALAAPFISPSVQRFDARDLPVPIGHQSVLDARYFGAQILSFPDAALSDTAAEANLTALNAAVEWAANTSGFILLPGGRVDILGTLLLRPGVGIGGIGEHHSMLRQRMIARSLTETYANVIGVDPTLRGGWNTLQQFTVNGGWDILRDFEGQTTGSAWDMDRARMTAAGIEYSTRGATEASLGTGANGGPIRPGGGSDSQVRFLNLKIENVAGDGLRMFGRGEARVNGLWTERCGREGLRTAMADSWYDNITCALSGDSAITLLGPASNSRWNNIKGWYAGCGKRSESIGAGIYMPSAGTFNVIMANTTTQDTWGPGLVINGSYGIKIDAQLDESSGGRPQVDGLGYPGARSFPRAHVRVTGIRQSVFNIGVTGGARNTGANFPYLIDFASSGIENNVFRFYGALNAQIPQTNPAEYLEMDLTGGTLSSSSPNPVWTRSKLNGVTFVAGLTNAKRYNEVWFGEKLMYGYMTLANLDDATHDVNNVRYGPSKVMTEFGVPAYKKAAEIGGGWEVTPITITSAAYTALAPAVQARGVFDVIG